MELKPALVPCNVSAFTVTTANAAAETVSAAAVPLQFNCYMLSLVQLPCTSDLATNNATATTTTTASATQ